jgi:dolichol-phosphate mannosyltransferase
MENQHNDLSLVIPFYNEEDNVREVVTELVSIFNKSSSNFELVLVDNGSVDNSGKILEDLALENPEKIKVVHVPVNQGYGWGIISGLSDASGNYVGFMSGDGQIRPEDVLKIFQSVSGDCDIVKANRKERRDGITRKALSTVYNFLFATLFNVHTSDVNGSPKIFKQELLSRIKPESKDWFLDAEVLIKAKCLNAKKTEVPVEFLRREKGSSHVKISAIYEFLKNMLNYRFGRGMREWKQTITRS